MDSREFKKWMIFNVLGIIAVLIVMAMTPKKINIDYEYLNTLNATKIGHSLNNKTNIQDTNYDPIKVRFTSYWEHDGTGSGKCTSSGLCIEDFDLNDNGWYLYQGKVVIATATYVCFYATDGPCSKYNSLPDNYNMYNIYDELIIFIDDQMYEAIVLDSCGASFWEEEHQRYDIFVSNEKSMIDVHGYVYEKD